MLFTTHAVVGAAIGAASPNIAIGFVGGFLSHHIIDAVPHFDQGSFYTVKAGPPYLGKAREPYEAHSFRVYRDWVMLFADWGVAAVLFTIFFALLPADLWAPIVVGAFGGLLPDIIDSSPLWSKKLRSKLRGVFHYHRFHVYFHWTVAGNEGVLGFGTQTVLVALSLWYLLAQ